MPGLHHRTLACGAAAFLLALSNARAATLNVPAQYATIQTAINVASSGDTVLVADGTYTGQGNVDLDFEGKAITVTSAHGSASTIIDCQGSSSNQHQGFYFHSGETSAAVLQGFTVINANPPGDPNIYNVSGGLDILGSSPTIRDFICANSQQQGIYISGGSPTLTDCTVSGSHGGGLDITESSSPILTRCTVSGNGGGIGVSYGSSPTINSCTATDNGGSGIGLYATGTLTATNCVFSGNQEFGISTDSSDASFTNCTVNANRAGVSGSNGSNTVPHHCTLTNCLLWGDVKSGEVTVYNGGTLTFSHCDVAGSFPPNGTVYGTDNINANPFFVHAVTDLRLRAGSPCLGAGTAVGAPTTDKDGNLRPATPSIGAYEGTAFKPPRFDFDGDGHNDFLWRNAATGQILTWDMDDQNVLSYNAPFATVPDTHWTVAAVADVDGDGHPDVLWQNTQSGELLFWLTATAPVHQKFAYGTPFAGFSDTNWHVVALDDLDVDGYPDILWQNVSTGQIRIWTMGGADGMQVIDRDPPYELQSDTVPDTHWQIVGTADFNGDGYPDLLWENNVTGQVLVWTLAHTDYVVPQTEGLPFATVPNTAWHIVGTGDMDGDGHPDIVWQNRLTGQVLRWRMGGADGQQVLSYGTPFAIVPNTHWQIIGIH